ncbi:MULTISPECIES: hypothetical protein [unclassified Mesorhizobium]|uniref:hypothetical protein n=1 Tax=unclassified Mesorhizobium TaxID=325217 RepID=UPI0033353539
MSAKVRIKAGPVEFEYEGETELSISDIKDLFSHIETLFTVPTLASGGAAVAEDGSSSEGNEAPPPPKGANKLHVNSIAAKIGAKTGPDVALAAAAYLQLMAEQDTFSRQELSATMKAATKYYNANMTGNLTKILEGLVGSKFNQVGSDQYSLTSSEHDKLEAALA